MHEAGRDHGTARRLFWDPRNHSAGSIFREFLWAQLTVSGADLQIQLRRIGIDELVAEPAVALA